MKGTLAGIAAASAVLMLATAVPASAHRVDIRFNGDHGWVGRYHRTVHICDGSTNGSRAYVDYFYTGDRTSRVYDPDGAGGNCGNQTVPNGGTVVVFRVCTTSTRCSDWRNA